MKKDKWRMLTTRQKIGFIRDYYTIHIVAALLTLAAVGWALNHYVINPPPRTFINISFYGGLVPENMRAELATNLTNSLVPDGENYTVMVDNFFVIGDPQFDMAMTQRMMAMVAASEIDIIIFAPGQVYDYIEAGFAAEVYDMADFMYFRDFARLFDGDFDYWTMIVMTNSRRYDEVRAFFDYIELF